MNGRKTLVVTLLSCALLPQSARSSTTQADFEVLAKKCAPQVSRETMAALVSVESSFNPYAIGVVGGRLKRQPESRESAIATALELDRAGFKYSAGLAQVFRGNWDNLGLTHETVFDTCANLEAGAKILADCYARALESEVDEQRALRLAFSCYYSNNFTTGFKPGPDDSPSYVQKIVASAEKGRVVVPPIEFVPDPAPASVQLPKPSSPEMVNFNNMPTVLEGQKVKAKKRNSSGDDDNPYVYQSDKGASDEGVSELVF